MSSLLFQKAGAERICTLSSVWRGFQLLADWSELCQSRQDVIWTVRVVHTMERGIWAVPVFARRDWAAPLRAGHKLSDAHHGKGDLSFCQSWQDVTELHHFWLDIRFLVHIVEKGIWTVLVVAKRDWAAPVTVRHTRSYAHCGKWWSELCQSWQDENELHQPWLSISCPMHILERGGLSFASSGKMWLSCASHA